MKSLFLQAPSFDGYDGGAGARYQMKREVKSFWYPTWLAQAAAMVEGAKLIDAPPHNLKFEDIVEDVKAHDFIVIHTSTPSFKSDCKTAGLIRELNPTAIIGFIGAKVAVEPEESLKACPALNFVARNEYEFTIKELAEGADWSTIKGLSYRTADGAIVHNPEREVLMDWDKLPSVLPLYKKWLDTSKYFGGYLKHPYVSYYTGRGCKSRCTFCLWPQTIGGHNYRFHSIERVVRDVKYIKENFPEAKEIFFDDDTLTDNHERVEALAVELGKLGVTWSCNAKANVPRKTLEVMKDNGLRLLLVGYESGNQKILHNIKKGLLVDVARRFAKDCHELGIIVHGTFILGLPGETRETILETLQFAKDVNPRTLQVSLAAPYPGTFLYKQAKENGWFASDVDLLTDDGTQIAPLNYPHLGHTEIFEAVEMFYKKFYFRPSKIAEIVGEMLTSREMLVRRLREGVEFFSFLKNREDMVVS
ncbi:hopanoid biosynthesis associated radical SAM protein HpnJ [Rhizomicrobium palustre]|uniref:Hopanoid biosynthesis associated radical SAM protein HpnJ n=1 Tax=Rhizomicrobium palustre TaxID=189966 RepID=A0A846N0M1_9PROT|nr:hopanoid biosynthesis associated radical SAM protein HpnJ [Rhizomicrobium palustre]NIK88792.1 hopanoid biosynthesis associated radical SAM protein HpnJ [Rhizomicrobium palustre]